MLQRLRFGFRWALLLLSACAPPMAAAEPVRCDRPFTLALHDHGLLYDNQTGEGIDRDMADALMQRSGCQINVSLMPRARIWQLIESGLLDFSLSGISNEAREKFASFGWYFSNKYYLLVRKDAGVQDLADFQRKPALKLGVIRSFRYSVSANQFVDALDSQGRVSHASALSPLYQVLLDNRLQELSTSSTIADLPAVLRVPLSQPVFVLGLLFVLVVYFAPGGLAAIGGRVRRWVAGRRGAAR